MIDKKIKGATGKSVYINSPTLMPSGRFKKTFDRNEMRNDNFTISYTITTISLVIKDATL